jgi:[ribosomal protein S18]-alanine N-acetyltransferase
MTGAENILLSEGGTADLPAVTAVMQDSFDPTFGEAWTQPQCASLLPLPGVWLTLAKDGDEVVGFALARIVVREAELLLLAVRKRWQGKGIGDALLKRFISIAAQAGAEKLHLEVRSGNSAISLYKRKGFEQAGHRKNYYRGRDGQVHDAITLVRTVIG